MKYFDFILTDEKEIDTEDYEERRKLIKEFSSMPIEFFSKLRHFQPQVGCLNACKICSQFSGIVSEFWTSKRVRNVIAAVKYSINRQRTKFPLIAWDRDEHRSGVIFAYLDNDLGNYFYLDTFISLTYKELGVKTRISTVGYSRYNNELNQMNERINSDSFIEMLGGVRLSFTPYAVGWCSGDNDIYCRLDYAKDIANFLAIYRPYYLKNGSGSRNMCVELRWKPLVNTSVVYDMEILGHKVIVSKNYLFISKNIDITMKESKIADPLDHSIKLTQLPEYFFEINLQKAVDSMESLTSISLKLILDGLEKFKTVEVYMMSNSDGIYYSIEPKLNQIGNYGINIYPCTPYRDTSGYIITERFFLNAMFEHKAKNDLSSLEEFNMASWEDAYSVLEICKRNAENYKSNNQSEKKEYIFDEIIPMIEAYIFALREANYSAKDFFDPGFTIDTGIICNLGRALNEFKRITNKINEPLTPNHARNYGSVNSAMAIEGVVWRLSCAYNNTIVIEERNLANTSLSRGQLLCTKKIQLTPDNEILNAYDIESNYLIPGQRRI